MQRSGFADLPLHGGRVPPWLAERMTKLGTGISESVLYHYGAPELLSRLSDPFWFQALGCVMGMDWHSSGITTIARSCGIGLSTVHEYLERAAAAGISWPLPEGLGEEELQAKLFGNQPVAAKAVRQRPQPDWKAIHEQLQQHRHLTLQLVWEEYRQAHPDGYRYSWFCERYQHWRRHLDVVLRQEHKAGEKMFVDWAGATLPVYDAATGEARPASLFVAVLGASSYTYAEATRDQQLEAWIHPRARILWWGTDFDGAR